VLTAPYQAFRAADGWINIGGANQSNWERLAEALGHPEWKADARFLTNNDRMVNLPALVELMNAVLVTKNRAEWVEILDKAGVPVGPVNTMGEALSHPQVLARDMVVEVEHPRIGRYKALGCPVHFSATPTAIDLAAPLLGEHTRGILREIGYDEGTIDALVEAGTVAEPTETAHA
jgi:crotonobetainyl-CoA:carnitine CoA-transferase CaiB-like acyl-CoA transferase